MINKKQVEKAWKGKRKMNNKVEKMWFECEYCSGDVDDRPFLDSKE